METINIEALAELNKAILDEEIVDPFVFNCMEQVEEHKGITYIDVMLAEYCKNAKNILNLAKTELESSTPRYTLIDNMLEKLEAASPRVAAKQVELSVTPVRLCLTGDPEDLDVAKSALCTLERDFLVFESHLRKFIELKKQVHIFDRIAATKSARE
ncbi:hypothetical protein LXL04_002494 [Taraxacum kok-saghyz]